MKWGIAVFAAIALFAEPPAPSVRDLEALLAKNPKPEEETSIRLQLVRGFELHSNWIAAADQLEHLRKLAPNDPEYAYQLGSVYQRISKASFQQMRSLAPKSARVQQIFGEQYSVTGDNTKAIRAYEAAIKADPKLQGSHSALAMIYLQAGRPQDAQAEIDKELALAPDSAIARQIAQAIQAGRP